MTRDYKKLLELVLYISQKANGDNFLGITKLNKLLFLTDFHYYLKTGKSITLQKYIHLPKGPVPKDMKKVEKKKEDVVFKKSQLFNYSQKRPIALREPDLSVFTAEEIAFIDEVIELICYKNKISASWLSEDSHDYIGWYITKDGEEIPYETIFLEKTSKQKASNFDKLYSQKLLREMGENYGQRQIS